MRRYIDEKGAHVEVAQGLDGMWIAARTSNGGKSHHRIKSPKLKPQKHRENAQNLLDHYAKGKRWQTLIQPDPAEIVEPEIVRETHLPAALRNEPGISAADLPAHVPAPHRVAIAGIFNLVARAREERERLAVTAVQIGLALQELKIASGYGGWLKFFRANVECEGLSMSTAEKYMAVAEHVRVRAVATNKLAGTNAQSRSLLLENRDALVEAMGEVVNVETWAELWRATGLLRDEKPRGGDHGGGKARQIAAQSPNAARGIAADRWADEEIHRIRETILGHNMYVYMSEPLRRDLLLTFHDGIVRIKNGPPKKEEGHEHTAS